MVSRPRIPRELKNRLHEHADRIEPTEPGENRGFKDALHVVLNALDDERTTSEKEDADPLADLAEKQNTVIGDADVSAFLDTDDEEESEQSVGRGYDPSDRF